MWGGVAIFVAFGPSWSLATEAGYVAANHLCPSNKPKKVCIRPCDTNSFTQCLTRKYHHTATENLYYLCSEKISWAPTFAGVSYQFGFVPFLICLEWKISRSSVFSFFFPWSFTKVRKVTDSNFANKFRWIWLGGLKSP